MIPRRVDLQHGLLEADGLAFSSEVGILPG